ncbi:TPA: triphosphoribosyl-dephospho-CoA synthase, partial [Salmonella enterica subsp. enterica serovar Typhimurium]|nr:triphosphoribosyl-dephospho-CoA synthase [Salmonella enterica subsp. enterica serovar Typhimurium]
MMPIPANPTNASIQPQSLYDVWADLAWRAMLTEVNLSPKPGLVDRLNCGAHKDMALADFHRSAEAIRHWLPRFMEYGASCTRLPPESVLAGLRPLGMACEAAMFRATAGVNTHKGSIFSLGLLCAAIGRLYQLRQPIAAETLCATAADFCRGLTT